MTEMLTRSVIDNRILRQTGQLDTTLGAAVKETFNIPTLGELFTTGLSKPSRLDDFTEEQRLQRREQEEARWRENDQLQRDLLSATDGNERDQINARLDELQNESDVQLDELTRESIHAGRLQPQDALQEQYGDLGLTFDRAMSQEEADIIAANKREEIVRNAIIEAGPKGVVPGIAKFGAGLASVAVDPLEVATMFIPVVGPAGRAATIGRFGRVGGRAIVGVTEGAVGSALTEPLYYGLSRAQQLDYTMSDALLNVGLGAVFGGALGTTAGVFSRSTEGPRLDPELTAQSADIALRQFSTGQSVNISRLLDGTDLRSTTMLSRVDGIEFQSARTDIFPIGQNAVDLRPTVITQGSDGAPRIFPTVQKADQFAEKVGGSVALSGDGFVVRQPLDGEITRDPYGKPLTFKTQRSAEKFTKSARDLPDGSRPISLNVNGRKVFGIASGMDAKSVRALEIGADTAEIPDGVNTREPAVLPDANSRMDEAIRRSFAETHMAKEFANDAQNIEMDPLADLEASARADKVIPENFAEETLEELDNMVKALGDDLSLEAKADLEEVKQIEIKARSYRAATEAAASCLLGSK